MTSVSFATHRAPSTTLVVGHRGASAVCPENTVEAFARARELGADGVELDVRRTADGHLAVHHDAALPDGRALIDVVAADLPGSVPSLAEALEACGSMVVNIEIKNDRHEPDFDADDVVAAAVAELLSGDHPLLPSDRVLVTSFNPATIATVHRLAAHVPTGRLTASAHDLEGRVARTAGSGHRSINPYDELVDEAMMAWAHAVGLEVYPWTVDDPERMQQLVDLRVDGIITNVPDVARVVVDAAG